MAWYKWADWLRLALCHSDTFMKNCGKRDWKKCAFTLSLLQSWKILSVSQYDVPAPLHWPWAQIPGRVCGPDTEITWFRKRARGIISKCCSWMSPRALVHQRPPACDYEGTRLGMGNVENGKPWKHHSFLTLHFPYFLWIWNIEVILTTCRWAPCCSQPKRMKGIGSAWWDADVMLREEGALLTQRIHLEKKTNAIKGNRPSTLYPHGHSGDHQPPLLHGHSLQVEALAKVPLWHRHTLSWPQLWEHPSISTTPCLTKSC